MRFIHFGLKSFLFMVVLQAGGVAIGQEALEGWNLEPSLGQAHLVMVAKVVSVSQVKVVEGAKTTVSLREYRFEPLKRLKGIFQRDQLTMMSNDFGLATENENYPALFKEGEIRLLILTQQQRSTFGGVDSFCCPTAATGIVTFEQRVPLLKGADDPLVGVAETLIKVADSPSRRERAELLLERLADVHGAAAIPLLTSLKLRADWAAGDKRAFSPVIPLGRGLTQGTLARLAGDSSIEVRRAALDVLGDMLASGNLPDDSREKLYGVGEAIHAILKSNEADTRVRLDALQALGHLLAVKSDYPWARDLLIAQVTAAATNAERDAALTALSRIDDPQATKAVLDALTSLPLDEPTQRESVYVRAALRPHQTGSAEQAEDVLLKRLERSIAARQPLDAEIKALGLKKNKKCLTLLMAAAKRENLSQSDRMYIAWALGKLGDDQAVPVLTEWLRNDQYGIKEQTLAALENIDSPLAAREVRPFFKTESHLPYKLRIARLLARQGIADGYELATEHLSDNEHTATAVLVLAALNNPRTTDDLSALVASRPDRRWYSATLSGLAAIGDADARKQLLGILGNDRNPMAADAANAVGLAGDAALLPPLAKLVQSRNKQIAWASLVAVQRYLSNVRKSPRGLAALKEASSDADGEGDDDDDVSRAVSELPAETRAALAKAAQALVVDAYVDGDVRQLAFAVAKQLRGEGYAEMLSSLADQAELEGSPLLANVQRERRGS